MLRKVTFTEGSGPLILGGGLLRIWESCFLSLKNEGLGQNPGEQSMAEQTDNILGDYYQPLAGCTDFILLSASHFPA